MPVHEPLSKTKDPLLLNQGAPRVSWFHRSLIFGGISVAAIAVIFLPVAWFLAPDAGHLIRPAASWPAFTLLLVLALVCSVGAYGLMNSWQPRMSATEAGLIYTTEPVFTAAFVLFLPVMLGQLVGQAYPNESLTFSLIAGGSLILSANLLMQWKRRPHPPAIAPAP